MKLALDEEREREREGLDNHFTLSGPSFYLQGTKLSLITLL